MKYKIQVAVSIEKKLARIPQKQKQKIIEKIDSLADNPKPDGYKKLKGKKRSFISN